MKGLFINHILVDVLVAAMPKGLVGEGEQLDIIKELNQENDVAGEELEQTRIQANIWRDSISQLVYGISNDQLISQLQLNPKP